MNWDKWAAIGTIAAAIATLLAVGVALLPIWLDYLRRRRLARNLRGRILLHLMALIHVFVKRAAPNSGPAGTDPLAADAGAMQEFRALRELFAQADALEPMEQNLLLRLLANLAASSLETVHPESNRSILAILREVHAELEKSPKKFLQGRGTLSKPPWKDVGA